MPMATQHPIKSMRCVPRTFSIYWRINGKIGLQVSVDVEDFLRQAAALLIHPDLFVRTDFRLFC
jgi:hypothetical protein